MSDPYEGLSASSKQTLQEAFAWAKKRKDQCLKDVKGEIFEYQAASLVDSSYSKSDVKDLFSGLNTLLSVSLDKDYNDLTTQFTGFLRIVLAETDKAGLTVKANINDTDSSVASVGIEKSLGALTMGSAFGSAAPKPGLGKLPSIAAGQALDKAAENAAKLTEENQRLQAKLAQSQASYNTMMQEKTKLQQELNALRDNANSTDAAVNSKITRLESELQELRTQIAEKNDQVAASQKELTGRLGSSTQFQTLKKMLNQRNRTIKELRERLNKYEPDADGTIEVEEEQDSD